MQQFEGREKRKKKRLEEDTGFSEKFLGKQKWGRDT